MRKPDDLEQGTNDELVTDIKAAMRELRAQGRLQQELGGHAAAREQLEAVYNVQMACFQGKRAQEAVTAADIKALVRAYRSPTELYYMQILRQRRRGEGEFEYDAERARPVLELAAAGDVHAIAAVRDVVAWLRKTGRPVHDDLIDHLAALYAKEPRGKDGRRRKPHHDYGVRAAVAIAKAAGCTVTEVKALLEALGIGDKSVDRIVYGCTPASPI